MTYLDRHLYGKGKAIAVLGALMRYLESIESVDQLDEAHVEMVQGLSCQFAVRRQELFDRSPLRRSSNWRER